MPLPFSFWFSLLLWIVFHNTLLSWSALNFCCPLYAISTVSVSSALRLSLGCSSATSGHLQLSFTRRNASHDVSATSIGPPCCESGVVSRFTSFGQYLECTETAMASAVLTVEADGNIQSPEFPRRVWFHPIAYWTTVRCHSSIQPSKSH